MYSVQIFEYLSRYFLKDILNRVFVIHLFSSEICGFVKVISIFNGIRLRNKKDVIYALKYI